MLPGQLYYAHVAYPPEYPLIVHAEQYDSKDESKSLFRIKPYSQGDETHRPVKLLNLEHDENLYVYRGKKRLMVVLGTCKLSWHEKELGKSVVLAAPAFSFKSAHPQELVVRTQAFDLPPWFYLPLDADGCQYESAVRFEYVQPVMASWLTPLLGVLSRKPVALSDAARDLLLVHLSRFLGLGEVTRAAADVLGDIKAYHDLLIEQLSKPQEAG